MSDQTVNTIQQEHILVCLSSSPSNERIVRTAGRMVKAFGCDFTALYVQTLDRTALSKNDLARLTDHIKLAERLGARIVTTHGEDVATQIAEYARLSGVTKIVIGRSGVQRRHFWNRPTLTERLIELAPGLDIHIIPDADIYKNYRQKPVAITYPTVPTVRELLLTLGILGIATAVGWVFSRLGFIDANIIAVYLLSVLLTSIFTSGYTCGILASFLSVILFNYFLTEPRLSLLAYDSGYPITFAIMLGIALLTGTLAAKLKAHAQLSARDVYRTKILFDTNQQLQKAAKPEDVYQMTATQMQRLMGRNILIYPAHDGVLLAGSFYPADDSQKELENPGGCEDPRVAVTEDGLYVMHYTQWNRKQARLAVATSRDLQTWEKHGPAFAKAYNGRFMDEFSKSASIVTQLIDGKQVIAKIDGKYWMYWGEKFVNVATSTDLVNWEPMLDENGEFLKVMTPRAGKFDSDLTECGPPAILTDKGILLLYNGKNKSGAEGDTLYTANSYCAGQALFDAKNPTKLIDRLDKPFYIPESDFEKSGQYPAGTVFIEGLVFYNQKWFLYYGCADSRVAVAVYDPLKK